LAFSPGVPVNTNSAGAGGTAYSWYYQNIPVSWSFAGREVYFDGVDKSPNGHCIVLSIADFQTQESIFISLATSNGLAPVLDATPQSYNTLSIWLQNTGSQLTWQFALEGSDFSGLAYINLTRLEQNQAQCTTNNLNGPGNGTTPTFSSWVSIVGSDTANGGFSGTMHAGGYGSF
jgi:hypothetical protein